MLQTCSSVLVREEESNFDERDIKDCTVCREVWLDLLLRHRVKMAFGLPNVAF